jgi:hypothetical protein
MSGKIFPRAAPRFRIGPDGGGRWIVCDSEGLSGAAFVSREAALRYARAECDAQPAPAADFSFVAALDWSEMFARPL